MDDAIVISSDDESFPEHSNNTKSNMMRSYTKPKLTAYLSRYGKSLDCRTTANSSPGLPITANPISDSDTVFNGANGIDNTNDSYVLSGDHMAANKNMIPKTQDIERVEVNQDPEIQKLSKALNAIRKRINKYEERDVNWDGEKRSNYLLAERYKEKAVDIYEKLCDLTGGSRHADRINKKPIQFTGTDYEEFNRKLEKLVNDGNGFPDFFDVLRIIDDCNALYNYRMSATIRQDIARDAFVQIGNLLQTRRRRDSYESVQYYTSSNDDPASADPTLKSKLDDNLRNFGGRIDEVIESFSRKQYRGGNENEKSSSRNDETNANSYNESEIPATSTNLSTETTTTSDRRSEKLNPQAMEMDIDVIIPNAGDKLQMNDEEAVTMTAMEPTGLFPIIVSVTSLHPSYNDLAELSDASALGPKNIFSW